jgi:acetyl-CoA acetyltransferase
MSRMHPRVAFSGLGEADRHLGGDHGSLDLCAQAAAEALADAGLERSEVDGLLTGYTLSEPYPFYSSAFAEHIGMTPAVQQTLSLGGATGAVLVEAAALLVAAGRCSSVLVVWGDRRSSLDGGNDQMVRTFTELGTQPDFETPLGATIPAMYALVAARHMARYGTEPQDLASVAVQARKHAALHPNATRREPLEIDDVLGSSMIASPLRSLDCCLIGDFAVAFVVTTLERARADSAAPVEILGFGQGFTHEFLSDAPDDAGLGAATAGRTAMEMAGVDARDLDFAELYDCFTITTLVLLEELGFTEPGGAAEMIASGATAIDGRMPVNTHGGLLSYGSGGITHIAEAITQLRGQAGLRQVDSPELAYVHNLGGILSLHAGLVLGNPR